MTSVTPAQPGGVVFPRLVEAISVAYVGGGAPSRSGVGSPRGVEYDPEWSALIPIQVGGRIGVDVAGMHARVDLLVDDLLQRLER